MCVLWDISTLNFLLQMRTGNKWKLINNMWFRGKWGKLRCFRPNTQQTPKCHNVQSICIIAKVVANDKHTNVSHVQKMLFKMAKREWCFCHPQEGKLKLGLQTHDYGASICFSNVITCHDRGYAASKIWNLMSVLSSTARIKWRIQTNFRVTWKKCVCLPRYRWWFNLSTVPSYPTLPYTIVL